MAGAKILVLYPKPTDVDAFERAYANEHVPMVPRCFEGISRFRYLRVRGSPMGEPPFHAVAELSFPSKEALRRAASSPGAQEAARHALGISTGGPMTILIVDETLDETY